MPENEKGRGGTYPRKFTIPKYPTRDVLLKVPLYQLIAVKSPFDIILTAVGREYEKKTKLYGPLHYLGPPFHHLYNGIIQLLTMSCMDDNGKFSLAALTKYQTVMLSNQTKEEVVVCDRVVWLERRLDKQMKTLVVRVLGC